MSADSTASSRSTDSADRDEPTPVESRVEQELAELEKRLQSLNAAPVAASADAIDRPAAPDLSQTAPLDAADGGSLRSQLADMFGMDAKDLSTAAAPRDDVAESDRPAAEPPFAHDSAAEVAEAEAADTLAASASCDVPELSELPDFSEFESASESPEATSSRVTVAIDPTELRRETPIDNVDQMRSEADGLDLEALYAAAEAERAEVVGEPVADEPIDRVAQEPTGVPEGEPTGDLAGGGLDGEEDSVAAYMERLLARSRGTEPSSPQPKEKSAAIEKKPAAKPTPRPQRSEPAVIRHERRVRKPIDKEKLRQEVSSLRTLALASSRAAVAKSRRRRMRSELTSKAVVVGVFALVSAVLLASPLWSRESFVLYGGFGVLVTLGFAYNFFGDYRKYRGELKAAAEEEAEATMEIDQAAQAAAAAVATGPATPADPVAVEPTATPAAD